MEKEKFTLRQKWFPTIDDSEELEKSKTGYYSSGIGQFFGRWARSIVLTGALIWGGYQGIGNNMEHSNGQIVGIVHNISERGIIWKTKEVQLTLEGRTSLGVYGFSIDKLAEHGENVDELYSQLRQNMEDGQRVRITYTKPLAVWPWRAGTPYLIQSVEPLEKRIR